MNQKELTLFFVWCWIQVLQRCARLTRRNRRYAARHPERVTETKRASYLKRKQAHLAYQREWVESNREQNRKLKREWNKKQRDTNPGWKLRAYLSSRMWGALRFRNRRSASTLKLLGCSIEQLKTHLQAQFRPGMTWDNYGDWHIDHIRPCASFDLTNPEQQRECFNFKNLQPLWAKDNLSKGAKYNAS